MPFLAMIPLAAQLTMPVADQPPVLDVNPSCRAADARSATGRSEAACMRSENQARTEMARQWAEFPTVDRSYCRQLSTMGGSPSYVELLTCLEIARDARALARKAAPSTTGQAAPHAER